ncbi:hypothetical protein MKL42_16450 [Acinetobacter sp. AOR15_HL]|uniref:hypothetical protein n=1 Tax=unclassified Acinetobacter TaxID=196816 RepID=UPI0022EAAFCF|nr:MULTISPECIES: hypothetical protein [unclassified Acinetobacter]MDA3559075.1 hypothetical protein [Acinetobacter sp. AOR15_HL]MDA3572334.1 hypothetical protein [Acinetobacter sp. AOR14_HL]
MNMIEIFKRTTTQVSRINMKKTFISISLLSTIIFSFNLYANDDTFVVSAKCKDEYNSSCDIVRTVNAQNEIVIKGVKLLNISKINQNLYKVKTSCGSPCSVTLFYSQNKEDSTDEFIAIDNKNNCLIESDSEKKVIYARKLFTNKPRKIVNLKTKEFNGLIQRFDYYSYFKKMSSFSPDGSLNLIANNESTILANKKIANPCGE